MITKPNDLAFPFDVIGQMQNGLTKREYFAARAMQGIVSNSMVRFVGGPTSTGVSLHDEEHREAIVNNAILLADALITELNKE